MKFAHEMGSVGLTGGVIVQLILSYSARDLAPAEYAAVRQLMLRIADWAILPSLVLVLTSGLLAMALHTPYVRAAWALIKLSTTILLFEGTLGGVQSTAATASKIATAMAAGDYERTQALADAVRHERGALWVLLGLCIANIALAVWRPKFRKRRSADAASDGSPVEAAQEAE